MIKYNPQFKSNGTLNGALSTAPSDSIVFDLPGKCIWVKGVKLKGTDTTYTFSHDNYITLANTPGDPEDIKIGVNTTALKNAIDTTYEIVSATVDGLAPKYNAANKASTDFYSSVYCLGVAGSTLKWYQIPHRTVRINSDTDDKLTSNDGEPLRISAGTNIGVTWNSTTKSIVISNTASIPENTDSNVAQYLASDDKNYRILFKGTLNDDNVIWSTRFSSTLLYNPSTKVLSVNGNTVLHAGNVNSANATIGTSLTTIATIGGVDIKAQVSSTDFKVTQTVTTTNSDYRILLKKTANDTEETDSSNFASTLLYNPSTKILKINGLKVIHTGNITSANATIGDTLTTLATFEGVEIKANIDSSSILSSYLSNWEVVADKASFSLTLEWIDSGVSLSGLNPGPCLLYINYCGVHYTGIFAYAGSSINTDDEFPLHCSGYTQLDRGRIFAKIAAVLGATKLMLAALKPETDIPLFTIKIKQIAIL